jgi:murein DD-endopeptidase MepM/ murein hydrolase activator NlpD
LLQFSLTAFCCTLRRYQAERKKRTQKQQQDETAGKSKKKQLDPIVSKKKKGEKEAEDEKMFNGQDGSDGEQDDDEDGSDGSEGPEDSDASEDENAEESFDASFRAHKSRKLVSNTAAVSDHWFSHPLFKQSVVGKQQDEEDDHEEGRCHEGIQLATPCNIMVRVFSPKEVYQAG